MKWWAQKELVVICYACRKRVSEDELASGAHNHYDKNDPGADAPTNPGLGLGGK